VAVAGDAWDEMISMIILLSPVEAWSGIVDIYQQDIR
jgi:hypothetical protein